MWGLLGIIPLATGVTGSCLLYSVMGVSTCPTKKYLGLARHIPAELLVRPFAHGEVASPVAEEGEGLALRLRSHR